MIEFVPTAARRFLVRCLEADCTHPLFRRVETQAHANNLHAKHVREYHTPTTDDESERQALIALLQSQTFAQRELNDAQAEGIADLVLAAGWVRPPC